MNWSENKEERKKRKKRKRKRKEKKIKKITKQKERKKLERGHTDLAKKRSVPTLWEWSRLVEF